MLGGTIGAIKGDTRSLDHGSCIRKKPCGSLGCARDRWGIIAWWHSLY